MNILNRGQIENFGAGLRDRIGNAYERIAGSDDYQRNDNHLRIIQLAVVTVSAIATGYVNAFAHRERIGDAGAILLAVLIVLFVERFYFVLRHGLTTTYKSGKQRFYALLCYRVIQASMILNATILTAWIVGFGVPPWLDWWNNWGSLGIRVVNGSILCSSLVQPHHLGPVSANSQRAIIGASLCISVWRLSAFNVCATLTP